jgi:cytochrome bd-type quinol oxidase subunit 2
VKTAEWAEDAATKPMAGAAAGTTPGAEEAHRGLLAALAGKQAARDRAVAQTTRRVVLTSLGVMQAQSASRRRSRALALAALLLVLLALGPFAWHVTEGLLDGEHMADVFTQTSLWICILCPVILAAVIVAGWARIKQ